MRGWGRVRAARSPAPLPAPAHLPSRHALEGSDGSVGSAPALATLHRSGGGSLGLDGSRGQGREEDLPHLPRESRRRPWAGQQHPGSLGVRPQPLAVVLCRKRLAFCVWRVRGRKNKPTGRGAVSRSGCPVPWAWWRGAGNQGSQAGRGGEGRGREGRGREGRAWGLERASRPPPLPATGKLRRDQWKD